MTTVFSTPAFNAQRDLSNAGIRLNRSQVFEAYAALFGYHHFQEMQPDLDLISDHLQYSSPWIVLQKELATKRLLSLGLDSGQVSPALQILRAHLSFPHVFAEEDAFLIDFFVNSVFKDWLLQSDNTAVWKAQSKVEYHCNVFKQDDVDFGYLIHQRGKHWEGTIGAQLHYRHEDGRVAYDGKFINIGARVQFNKLSRILLEPDAQVSMGASAILPHGGLGGITL